MAHGSSISCLAYHKLGNRFWSSAPARLLRSILEPRDPPRSGRRGRLGRETRDVRFGPAATWAVLTCPRPGAPAIAERPPTHAMSGAADASAQARHRHATFRRASGIRRRTAGSTRIVVHQQGCSKEPVAAGTQPLGPPHSGQRSFESGFMASSRQCVPSREGTRRVPAPWQRSKPAPTRRGLGPEVRSSLAGEPSGKAPHSRRARRTD